MANAFSKEERVAYEQMLEGFNDALVMSRNVSIYNTDSVMMERASDTIWRPMPYIAQSHSGTDATSNFDDNTQLSVPVSINTPRHSTAILTATELRDAMQEGRLGRAAMQKLASDINVSVMNTAALQGTLVVKRTAAASGFDDIAQCEAIMNEQGVQDYDRVIALSTRDYNGMASNLAARETLAGKALNAYERSRIGMVGSFEAFKLDTSRSLTAAAGGGSLTIDTRSSASNYWVPKATSTAATGQVSNVDNRYQTITISSTTSVAAGDAFTIANVFSVHQITKQATSQLKTFRVISVDSSTTMTISPPIISAQGGSDAEIQYQNCSVSGSGSATAGITFLNTVTASANPFWQKDAIEIIPGRYAVPSDAGVAVIRGTVDNGIEVTMTKQFDINTYKTKYRWDVFYGTALKQPEMAGIILFGQS